MKAIMISINPKYVAGILNGKKIMEIRKTTPKCDFPIDVYIYCTKDKKHDWYYCEELGCYFKDILDHDTAWEYLKQLETLNGKVVAKFTLNDTSIIQYHKGQYIFSGVVPLTLEYATMCSYEDIDNYLKGKNGYTWHIRNLEIFDRPKEISEFKPHYGYPTNHRLTRAPQSWCWIEM